MVTDEQIEALILKHGAHQADDGKCVMEAVAWVAGEPHSDHPACVSPVLGAFLRRWNDDLDDEGRQKLKPYIRRVIGTAGDPEADECRAWLATDWMVRTYLPAWLELAKLDEQAAAVRALPPIVDRTSCEATSDVLQAARERSAAAWGAAWGAAGAAARGAAWDAARAAAWDAARAAARDAAGDAAEDAAGAAAWDAAWAAARDAARGAAWDAARAALKPTVTSLQQSALGLLDRMIEARP